nr:FRG domain-containing protein [Schaalia odontolytica]
MGNDLEDNPPTQPEIEIHSISELLQQIKETRDLNKQAEADLSEDSEPELWFRGQSNSTWQLSPGLWRDESGSGTNNEMEYLYQFRQVAAREFNSLNLDKWGWLTYAQHHTLPTRLLDWSTQPLIALYFACHEQTDRTSDLSNGHGALFILNPRRLNRNAANRTSIFNSNPRGTPPLLIESNTTLNDYHPELSNNTQPLPPIAARAPLLFERIIFQSGTFTIHTEPEPGKDSFENCVTRILIPDTSKQTILEELHILGISEFSIYRDLDRAAQHLKKEIK